MRIDILERNISKCFLLRTAHLHVDKLKVLIDWKDETWKIEFCARVHDENVTCSVYYTYLFHLIDTYNYIFEHYLCIHVHSLFSKNVTNFQICQFLLVLFVIHCWNLFWRALLFPKSWIEIVSEATHSQCLIKVVLHIWYALDLHAGMLL